MSQPQKTLVRPRPRATARRFVRGSAMLEAIVALILFGAGILGLVGLQARMVTAQTEGNFRADAVYLASELVGTMWADVPNLASYTTAQCANNTRCKRWSDKVAATLPAGSATVTVDNGLVTISLSWAPPNYGTHTYTTSTAIRI
jgi:type IV pilus assembly protein PilV